MSRAEFARIRETRESYERKSPGFSQATDAVRRMDPEVTWTTSWAGDWERFPGSRRVALRACPKCGSLRSGSGPHAPHYRRPGELVDCAGVPL